ncbi:MAG: hypothetical protein M1822_010191 [Bathelium mastoideum]|nr:MAG: hypothetical protein M1822_010191 [Bathelium mastoideum]
MPSRNARARAVDPMPSGASHEIQSRPSTASGSSSHDSGHLQQASAPFSQPSQGDTQRQFAYGSAENAVYEASLQLRNPNGFPSNPPTQYQVNMSNGSTSRPSTSGQFAPHSREHNQQAPQYQQYSQDQSQSAFGYPPGAELSYSANQYSPNDNIDPSLQRDQPGNPPPPIQQLSSEQFSRHSTPNEFGQSFQGFAGPSAGETDGPKKRGAASSATNDRELREILVANEGRSLRDVAAEVLKTERTPKAEKTKQLFAMLWLRATCKTAKTSVPRNRVYSFYADRCATERVVPLNPASFGKLVRVIFPGIQTRRLGVRGESKYHYVDLALEGDDQNTGALDHVRSRQLEQCRPRHGSMSTQIDFSAVPRLQADTAAFPSQDHGYESQPSPSPPPPPPLSLPPQVHNHKMSYSRIFAEHPHPNGPRPTTTQMYSQPLFFPSSPMPASSAADDVISLPSIHQYLPPKTDQDTASALAALYRTHCTSLIDCIRFCKEKQFFRLFTSFGGTLTVPVQKLFSSRSIAPWIRECDWLMYQKMVRFVAPLALQAAPPVVLSVLNTIAQGLREHLTKTFANYAPHVLDAKMEPATLFCGLLQRLLRVNEAAHAAANLLTDDANREQMWLEWVVMVNPKRVMEMELPGCGYEEVAKALGRDVRALLMPLQHQWLLPQQAQNSQDPFAVNFGFEDGDPEWLKGLHPAQGDGVVSTENVLDRWAAFLSSLSRRFPQASTRTILHCIGAVGTAALRDITMAGGVSYSAWWVTKVFVDEMSNWLAAMGGFLEHQSDQNETQQEPESHAFSFPGAGGLGIRHAGLEGSQFHPAAAGLGESGERFSSAPPAPNVSQQPAPSGPQTAPIQQANEPFNFSPSNFPRLDMSFDTSTSQPNQSQEADLDDSGIGMSLMDDAFKFNVPDARNSGGNLQEVGAPPA